MTHNLINIIIIIKFVFLSSTVRKKNVCWRRPTKSLAYVVTDHYIYKQVVAAKFVIVMFVLYTLACVLVSVMCQSVTSIGWRFKENCVCTRKQLCV